MWRYCLAIAMLAALSMPVGAQLTPQQQRMKDCNAQAAGMNGKVRKDFMSSCLSGGTAESKKPRCVNGKPCGDTCIAKNEVCHK